MDKVRIEEIRARYREMIDYHAAHGMWSVGAMFCEQANKDIPDLLDALEVAMNYIAKIHDGKGPYSDEVLAKIDDIEKEYDIETVSIEHHAKIYDALEAVQTENEKFRVALRRAEQRMQVHVEDGGDKFTWCSFCHFKLDDEGGHANDCPFKILEQ